MISISPNAPAPQLDRPVDPLVTRLKAGEPGAYDQLVETYMPRMLILARRMLNEDDAADAVQDALISAVQGIDRFNGRSQLWTWLHRITVNACLMLLRGQKNRKLRSLEAVAPNLEVAEGSPRQLEGTEEAVDELARTEMQEIVRGAIETLPEDFRDILLLRDIQEVDTRETAQRLGISRSAAKTRLHRARHALRRVIEPRMNSLA